MTHAFVPQHLIEFAEYIQKIEFSNADYNIVTINDSKDAQRALNLAS